MELHVLNSNSSGNGYLLMNEDSCLILEAGVPLAKAKKAFDFEIEKVCGLLLSHEHGDHAKYVQQYLDAGIKVFTSKGTMDALELYHWNWMAVRAQEELRIGPFLIIPFKVEHDVNEPLGFLIWHDECGTTLFVTDTHYLNFRFSGMNNIILECNYCEDILEKNHNSGKLQKFLVDRIVKSHMSIQTVQKFLSSQDLSTVNNIVLCHLSDTNSDARGFVRTIYEQTGKTVYAADKNMIMQLNKTPF